MLLCLCNYVTVIHSCFSLGAVACLQVKQNIVLLTKTKCQKTQVLPCTPLTVEFRIQYKAFVITYQTLNGDAEYIYESLPLYSHLL